MTSNPSTVVKRRPLRVLHLVPGTTLGGAQRVVHDLTKRLSHDARFVTQLCVLGKGEHVDPSSALESPPLVVDFSGRLSDGISTLRAIRQLRAILDTFDADILHTHLWIADILGALAVRHRSTRHVIHLHDTRPWLSSSALRDQFRRWIYRTLTHREGTCFIAVSKAVQKYTCKHLPVPEPLVHVILNGIDTQYFDERQDQTLNGHTSLIIGAAGRFVPEKGFEQLITALKRLVDAGIDGRLRLAGEGSERIRYEQLASRLNLFDRLEICNRVENMKAFYHGLDVFVMPSIQGEGLPLSVLEAMASGLPVVATADAGTPEAVQDGREGLIVPPGDAEALANALSKLARDESLRRQMGQRASLRVRADFGADRVAAQVTSFYETLFDGMNPHPASTHVNS